MSKHNVEESSLANAQLIAIAAELMSVIADCLKELDRSERPSYRWQMRAKAAIAKAERGVA